MCVCRQRCWAQVAKEHTLSFLPRLPLLPPGDLVITLWLSTRADSLGRKRVLLVGCCLKCLAGVTFASTRHFWALAASGVIGVISTSGGEIGPFMSVEQGCGSDGRARCVGGRFSGLIANVSVPGLGGSPLVGAGEEVGGCTSFVLHSDTTPFLSLPLLHPPPSLPHRLGAGNAGGTQWEGGHWAHCGPAWLVQRRGIRGAGCDPSL